MASEPGLSKARTGIAWLYIHGVENRDEAYFLTHAKAIHRELIRKSNAYTFFGKPVACQFGYVYWGDLAGGVQGKIAEKNQISSRSIMASGLARTAKASPPGAFESRQLLHQFSHDAIWYLTNPAHQTAINARVVSVYERLNDLNGIEGTVLAGHSLGSVIALKTITMAIDQSAKTRDQLAGLVTYGSPVTTLLSAELEQKLAERKKHFSFFNKPDPTPKPWINVMYGADPVASGVYGGFSRFPEAFTFSIADATMTVNALGTVGGFFSGKISPHAAYSNYPQAFVSSLKVGQKVMSK
ncbi:MAG: hypothetical protein VKJ06_03695 [Vampirovibrionales bacterium]|nr:hypothetical protein [Vampirovibrionales bacterium]